MDDAPKRSLRDTITQLIVIAILLALIVGSVIFLRQYIDSRNSSDGPANVPTATKATFGFTCCTGFNPATIYRPGEVIRLAWTPVQATPGAKETITLSAKLSTSFPSAMAIKSSVKDGKKASSGPFIATSSRRVSDHSGATPLTIIRIPSHARTGYYDLVTNSSQKDLSVGGASIFEIRR